jgi:5-formyltetrahydrofolate cyclo-ligase
LEGETSEPKERVRQLVRCRLSLMSAETRSEKSSRAISKLKGLEEFSKAKCVMTYVSKQDEVDTTGLIEDMLSSGKRVVVPLIDEDGKDLVPCEILDLEELREGIFGVMEPDRNRIRPVAEEDIDLVIVPGRAFDVHCNRLGRGKGYFDRFLKRLGGNRRTIGLAFSEQFFDEVPSGENDVRVDIVVTDAFVIRSDRRGFRSGKPEA